MKLRDELLEVIGDHLRMSAHDDSVSAEELLNAILDTIAEAEADAVNRLFQ